MRKNSLITGSWVMLIIAIASWGAVGFFIMTVLQMQSERASYLADAAAANLEQGQAAQLHALARETVEDRATLEATANVDVLTAVNMIESVNASGTPVHVVNAQTVKTAAKSGPQQMSIVDLTTRSEGSFSSIMRIMQILETLPLNTTVQEVNFSRPSVSLNEKNTPVTWSLNMRLRFYTTATLST